MKKKAVIIILVILVVLGITALVTGGIIFAVNKFILTPQEETEQIAEKLDLSSYYDDNGYFKDLKASDYVEVADINSLEIPEELKTVEASVIDAEIQNILAQYPSVKEKEDVNYMIQNGDTVNIDYVGSVDGVEFEGGSTMGQGTEVVIGVTQYIDGFLDQLIGRKKGENFDITVTFPESYPNNTDLQSKEAIFNITINGIYEEVVLELTDEFVQTNYAGQFQTAEEFRKNMEELYIKFNKVEELAVQLSEKSTVKEYPSELVDYNKKMIEDQITTEATSYQMTLQDYLAMYGFTSFDEYYESSKAQIEETMKMSLIYQAIAENNNITVKEEDISKFFLENYGSEDWSTYKEQYGENYIKNIVLEESVNLFLIAEIEK